MASNDYHFTTHWRVQGTVEEVAQIIGDPLSLVRWWRSVYLDVRELAPGGERGIGREIELYTKGWLPYTLCWSFRIVESRYPHGFTIEPRGDFTGSGTWTFAQDGPWVDVTYEWNVNANKPLLRYLTPVLRPVFEANHRWAMAKGEESLRLELARRHAQTAEERALIPPPPQATTTSPLPLLLGAAGAAAAIGSAVWLLRRMPIVGGASLLAAGTASAIVVRRALHAPDVDGPFEFDPDRVAHFEATGWRAYYDREWPKLLSLIVRLSQEQFRIPFPVSLLAAYYVTRAAQAWVPLDHDEAKVRHFYERFYRLAQRYSGLRFDPARAAALELEHNDIHRRLVGNPDKQQFVETMVALHSTLFGITPEQARESAELRVQANTTVDGITGGTSADVEGDWATLEDELRRCYRSIQRAMRSDHERALPSGTEHGTAVEPASYLPLGEG